jgi:serine/threonine-protein kinase
MNRQLLFRRNPRVRQAHIRHVVEKKIAQRAPFLSVTPKTDDVGDSRDCLKQAIARLSEGRENTAKINFDLAEKIAGRDNEDFLFGLQFPLDFEGHVKFVELQNRIGFGGEATVYRAVCDRKTLAVKLSNIGTSERINREARALRRIDSENVVRLLGYGTLFGRTALGLELMDGHELQTKLDEIQSGDAAFVMQKLCKALIDTHESGIYHFDVTPANVFCRGNGVIHNVSLIDFGCSREAGFNGNGVCATDFSGTLGYISPERIRGQESDGRADIFSAGVLLYEMIHGDNPFDASDEGGTVDTMESFRKILCVDPIPEGTFSQLDQALLNVALRAMSKSPDDRYPDAKSFLDEIETVFSR